jgi:hypothetical protein
VGNSAPPANVAAAAEPLCELKAYRPDQSLHAQLDFARLAMVCLNGQSNDAHALTRLLDELDRSSAVAIFLLPRDARLAWSLLTSRHGPYLCVHEDAGAEEIAAKLSAAASLQPVIQNLQSELVIARNGGPAHAAVDGLDEEMRLAARLQRDFLPRRLPEIGPVRFGVLYRPASWVSGDIYDVTRLDETHVGFYVADAVGHGLPAALLTMFIKKALQTKRIVGQTYEIVPPHVSLAELNADICEQNLNTCHFCTALYGVLNTIDGSVTYARAGHPEPILFRADGSIERPDAPGSLLGVFSEEQYVSQRLVLSPGERLLLFTDGVEGSPTAHPAEGHDFFTLAKSLARAPREELLLEIASWIDTGFGESGPQDDITILVVDMEKR